MKLLGLGDSIEYSGRPHIVSYITKVGVILIDNNRVKTMVDFNVIEEIINDKCSTSKRINKQKKLS